MKRWFGLGLTLTVIAVWVSGSWAGMIGPSLQGYLAKSAPDQKLPVIIALKQQADNAALEQACVGKTKEQRWAYVVGELKNLSDMTQRDLLSYLAGEEQAGKVAKVNGFWIVNAVYCEATPEVIQAVVARPEVYFADYDLIYSHNILNMAASGRATGDGRHEPPHVTTIEWNVHLVGADSVWNLLGYHGDNVIVGHIDTGCNRNHLDLVNHMWTSASYPNHGWNFESNNNDPTDIAGHGTHTSGTVASDGSAGDSCGMAPRARLMTCRVRTTADSIAENQVWAAEQFCVAPPLDPTNHAQLITMSLGWEYAWTPRLGMWRQSTTNVATAGLPFQIAAGNERGGPPVPYNLRVPGSCPGPWHHPAEAAGGRSGAITIGATDNTDAIASFSSQGPVAWDTVAGYNDYPYPPGLLKPDVSAPGVNITSCDYQNNSGYLSGWSGTSMATPCASGVVALMLQKNPTLLPAQVDSILQYSVRPLGSQPKNNDFGTGRISAYLAVVHTPLPGPQHDVAIQSILAPGARVDPLAAVAPVVVVHNNGTYHETSVPVHFRVDSSGTQVYSQLVTVPSLDSAKSDTVTFPNWTPGPGGITYNLIAYTANVQDTNRTNDTLKSTTQTRVHEISSVSTSIGSRVRALTAITPQLTLGDPGDYTEKSFNATCWIDSGATRLFNQTVVVDSVVSGGSKTVSFPVWNTGPVGATYNVTMFNSFADPNHGNDTLKVATQASNQAKALIAFADLPANAWAVHDTLVAHDSSHLFSTIDTFNVGTSGGRVLPLSTILQNGYNVVVTWTNYGYSNSTAMGDTMAAFMDQGGGVVIAVFADQNGIQIGGRYATQYMPLPTNSNTYTAGTLGTVHLPTHPIMAGISAISVGSYVTAASTLQHGVDVADFNTAHILAGAFDTLGRRTAALGFFPATFNYSSWGGQDAHLILNAMCWAAGLCNPSGVEALPALGDLPRIFALAPARPNPVSGATEIRYQLPTASPVQIRVYNVSGQVVKTLVDAKQEVGYKSVTWDGRNDRGVPVGSGVYLYRMEAGSFTATRKMVVVR